MYKSSLLESCEEFTAVSLVAGAHNRFREAVTTRARDNIRINIGSFVSDSHTKLSLYV